MSMSMLGWYMWRILSTYRIEIENWLVNIELADDEGAEKVGFDLVNADILNVDIKA